MSGFYTWERIAALYVSEGQKVASVVDVDIRHGTEEPGAWVTWNTDTGGETEGFIPWDQVRKSSDFELPDSEDMKIEVKEPRIPALADMVSSNLLEFKTAKVEEIPIPDSWKVFVAKDPAPVPVCYTPSEPLFSPLEIPSSYVAGTSFHLYALNPSWDKKEGQPEGDLVVWTKDRDGGITGGWVFSEVTERLQKTIRHGVFPIAGRGSAGRSLKIMIDVCEKEEGRSSARSFKGVVVPANVGTRRNGKEQG